MLNHNFDDSRLDNELAEFTDQVLGQGTAETGQLSYEDEELRKLQMVVVQLKEAGLASTATPKFSSQLQEKLVSEFQRLHGSASQQVNKPHQHSLLQKESLLQRMKNYFNSISSRTLSLQFAAVGAVILLIALLILSPADTGLTGTAGLGKAAPFLIASLGIVAISIVFWMLRKK